MYRTRRIHGDEHGMGKLGILIGFGALILILLFLFALAILAPLTLLGILLIFGGLALIAFRPSHWWVGLIILILGVLAAVVQFLVPHLAL